MRSGVDCKCSRHVSSPQPSQDGIGVTTKLYWLCRLLSGALKMAKLAVQINKNDEDERYRCRQDRNSSSLFGTSGMNAIASNRWQLIWNVEHCVAGAERRWVGNLSSCPALLFTQHRPAVGVFPLSPEPWQVGCQCQLCRHQLGTSEGHGPWMILRGRALLERRAFFCRVGNIGHQCRRGWGEMREIRRSPTSCYQRPSYRHFHKRRWMRWAPRGLILPLMKRWFQFCAREPSRANSIASGRGTKACWMTCRTSWSAQDVLIKRYDGRTVHTSTIGEICSKERRGRFYVHGSGGNDRSSRAGNK